MNAPALADGDLGPADGADGDGAAGLLVDANGPAPVGGVWATEGIQDVGGLRIAGEAHAVEGAVRVSCNARLEPSFRKPFNNDAPGVCGGNEEDEKARSPEEKSRCVHGGDPWAEGKGASIAALLMS